MSARFPDISLCLLTRNEIGGCRRDVPRLPFEAFGDSFALDGGSVDGTDTFLAESGVRVVRQRRRSYNGAYHEAIAECQTRHLLLFHPKGTIDPRAVLRVAERLEAGMGLVIATRLGSGARNEEDDRLLKPRKWFVYALGLAAWGIWGRKRVWIRDVLHGFRGMDCAAFRAMEVRAEGVTVDLELVVQGYQHRLAMAEVPVREERRAYGGTHFKAWPTGKALLRYLFQEWWRSAGGQRVPAARTGTTRRA